MLRRLPWSAIPLILVLALPAASAIELFRSSLDSGGGSSTAGALSLTGTIGQPDVGKAAGESLVLNGGFWYGSTHVTAVGPGATPRVSRLEGAVPNPFNPSTTIRFDLAQPGRVTVRLYSVAGRMIRELHADVMDPGTHELVWDGRDDDGRSVASGTYLVQMRARGFAASQKLSLIK